MRLGPPFIVATAGSSAFKTFRSPASWHRNRLALEAI